MKNTDFTTEVEEILYKIADDIEEQDPEGDIDIDLHDGILNLTTESGVFVINKQSVTKEIWLSSPISGPYHFAFNGQSWVSRSGADLFVILETELQMKISR